eukprot:4469816-Pleurochrysis_carterae.AAC.2
MLQPGPHGEYRVQREWRGELGMNKSAQKRRWRSVRAGVDGRGGGGGEGHARVRPEAMFGPHFPRRPRPARPVLPRGLRGLPLRASMAMAAPSGVATG